MSDEVELYNENFSPQKNKAVDLILEGKHTNKQIAEKVDVSQKTIAEWKNDPEVVDEINYRKAEFFKRIYNRLNQVNEKAVKMFEYASEKAMSNASSEQIVENAKKISDMAKDMLKATGHHGDSVKELIEEQQEESSGMEITKEEEAILNELRACGEEELSALGSIMQKYTKEELIKLGKGEEKE